MSRFVHSFSARKKYKQCPDLFHKDRVLRLYPFVQGPEAKRGDDVHRHLAGFIGKAITIPEKYREQLMPVATAAKNRPGKKYVEQKLGLRKDGSACGYFDEKVYTRCIVDYLCIDGEVAYVWDWKTGKDGYPDVDQLVENAVAVFAHHPQVKVVKALLVFVDHGTTADAEFDREYLSDYLDQVLGECAEIDEVMEAGEYGLTPGPLCPWCPVTDCKFWSPPRKK